MAAQHALCCAQDLAPESVALNGSPCKVYFDTRQAASVKTDMLVNQTIHNPKGRISKEDIHNTFPWGNPAPASQSAGNQPLSARNGILYGVDGNPVVLKVGSFAGQWKLN